MRPSADGIAMTMQRDRVPDTGAYDTSKSNNSSMADPSAHVIWYRSYWSSMSVVFTLKYILGLSIFVFDGNNKRKNGAPNVVDFPFSRILKKLSHTSYILEDS